MPVHCNGLQQRYSGKGKTHKDETVAGEVVLGFRLYGIRDVSHSNHQFQASFRCFFEWTDPSLAARLESGMREEEWAPLIPEVSFTNSASLTPELWTHAPRVLDPATGRLMAHRRYEGLFHEELELRDFPFDVQQLTVHVQLASSRFRRHTLRLLPLEFRGVPPIPGWSLVVPSLGMSDDEVAASRKAKATLAIKLRVRREAGFYVRSILAFQLLLTSLTVISFMLSVDAVWDRVEVQLALIFALLGLRFSVTSAIPIVPVSRSRPLWTLAPCDS